jgi:tripartite-type tricarboxylate transporter receptor subunit TctC
VQNVLTRPADGSTLLFTTSSPVVFNKFLYKKLPYDPQRDLEPLVIFARGTMMLGTSKTLPYSDLSGLVADAKKRPEKLNFGYATSTQQLVGELFQQSSGTKFTFIAYKTNAAMLQALITGEVDLAISDPAGFDAYIKSKQINVIAATSPDRLSVYPDVPTLVEQGIDLKLQTFNGVFANKGISPGTRDALVAELKDLVKSKEMRDYTRSTAMDEFVVAGKDAKAYMADTISSSEKMTREAGVQAQQ